MYSLSVFGKGFVRSLQNHITEAMDKLMFSVRGWRERVEPLRVWWPAGTLAARVLERPGKRFGLLAALAGLGPAGDQDRFRRIIALGATRRRAPQAWIKARVLAEMFVEPSARRIEAWQPGHSRQDGDVTPSGLVLPYPPRLILVGRNEEHFLTTPAGAVALSAAMGVARGTLRVCSECGRFMVCRRAGFVRRHCEECRSKRRPFGKTPPSSNDEKAQWFRRVADTVYRRYLREDRKHQELTGVGSRHATRNWRKKHPLSPEAKQAYEAWRRDVLQRLLVSDDLQALEQEVVPKRNRGPKPKTTAKRRGH